MSLAKILVISAVLVFSGCTSVHTKDSFSYDVLEGTVDSARKRESRNGGYPDHAKITQDDVEKGILRGTIRGIIKKLD